MVFQKVGGKSPEVNVRCSLVALEKKAEKDQTIYLLKAANERVLQELIFRGDKAKHVFLGSGPSSEKFDVGLTGPAPGQRRWSCPHGRCRVDAAT